MSMLLNPSMFCMETVRLISCFRLAPICLVSELNIKNVNSLYTIEEVRTIPYRYLSKSLDDVSEKYLISTAFKLASNLSKLNPTHTFNLPLVQDSAISRYNGLSLRCAKREEDYIFEICCNSIK